MWFSILFICINFVLTIFGIFLTLLTFPRVERWIADSISYGTDLIDL